MAAEACQGFSRVALYSTLACETHAFKRNQAGCSKD